MATATNRKEVERLRLRGEGAVRLCGLVVAVGVMSFGVFAGTTTAASPVMADGRSYELVSPADKNGGDIAADRPSILSAAGGDAVTYLSRGSFGDTVGSGVNGQTQYLSRRERDGWATHAITPLPRYDASQALVTGTVPLGFSADLRRAVVWGYDLPGVPDALPQTPNIYSENTTSRTLQLVTRASGPVNRIFFLFDFAFPDPGGVSRDSRHIAFRAITPLLSDAPFGVPNVYEWDNGTLRLASILPDDNPAAAGAMLVPRYRESISPDGSRVTFISPPDPSGQLYMRVDHASTAWISEPENGAPPPQDVVLQQVTGDSRHVIFATSSRLLDDDPNDGSDLYLYTDSADPASDANLTLVSDTGDVPGTNVDAGTAVVGSSDDARRIYYYKGGRILLWEEGATTVVTDDAQTHGEGMRFAATDSEPGAARVSPDGRFLAFISDGTLSSANGAPITASGGHFQIYLYDSVQGTLRCVSCPSTGVASSDASIVPNVTTISPQVITRGLRPPYLADDGRTFFSTAEPLVARDINGVTDAYEFDPTTGQIVLLSTGKGSEPAAFAAASASGDDAFIVTRQQLVKADRDLLVDVYDARVGGGFPEAQDPAPPCDGDACQGVLAPTPEEALPGSLRVDEDTARQASVRVVRRTAKGARAQLRVLLSAAGTVMWRGSGLHNGSHKFATAGSHAIVVTLSSRARRALRGNRTVRVQVRLTLTTFDGASSSAVTSLTFSRPSSKKGH
ncbi:MAG TPA: hypothetical protein VF250_02200 [Conexibacter sp.]